MASSHEVTALADKFSVLRTYKSPDVGRLIRQTALLEWGLKEWGLRERARQLWLPTNHVIKELRPCRISSTAS